jgi:hypothetical protein
MPKAQGPFLRKADYEEIRRVVREELQQYVTKDEMSKLNQSVAFLPTKDDYYNSMDKMMMELKVIREEFASHLNRHQENEVAIKNLTHKVKNLYKVFIIDEPADVVSSY